MEAKLAPVLPFKKIRDLLLVRRFFYGRINRLRCFCAKKSGFSLRSDYI